MKKRTIIALTASILLTVNTPSALAAQIPAEASTPVSAESTLANGKAVTEENVLELLRQIEEDTKFYNKLKADFDTIIEAKLAAI